MQVFYIEVGLVNYLINFAHLSISQERTIIQDSYKKKAKLTTEILNSMEGVKCNEVAGAMYAFPRITLSQRAIEEAKVPVPPTFARSRKKRSG